MNRQNTVQFVKYDEARVVTGCFSSNFAVNNKNQLVQRFKKNADITHSRSEPELYQHHTHTHTHTLRLCNLVALLN